MVVAREVLSGIQSVKDVLFIIRVVIIIIFIRIMQAEHIKKDIKA